jgi:hypothetical protein
MQPAEEKYAAEIELALYNAMLRQMVRRPAPPGDLNHISAADEAGAEEPAGQQHHQHQHHHHHHHHHHHRPHTSGSYAPPRPADRAPVPRGTAEQQQAALAQQLQADALAVEARAAMASPSPPLCTGGATACAMVAAGVMPYFMIRMNRNVGKSQSPCPAVLIMRYVAPRRARDGGGCSSQHLLPRQLPPSRFKRPGSAHLCESVRGCLPCRRPVRGHDILYPAEGPLRNLRK